MKKIVKVIYVLITILWMAITGENTVKLKDIDVKIKELKIPKITSQSQININ